MPAKKEDEIMAEYLLKGGKMLEKTCRTCGCPLFEFKGETFCVVCAENKAPEKNARDKKNAEKPAFPKAKKDSAGHGEGSACDDGDLEQQLASAIQFLCRRIRDEQDPDIVITLMNAVRSGCEALSILRQS